MKTLYTFDPLRDHISKVEYIDHMGSDLSVVNAARVSFDKESVAINQVPMSAGLTPSIAIVGEKDAKLIHYLAKHGHWTPFGHATVSLRVKAPVFVARQLVKHQVGLVWNEVSRRYVSTPPEFYWPTKLNSAAANVKQGSTGEAHGASGSILTEAHILVERLSRLYSAAVASEVAPEDARMFLPVNMYTEWVWSGSLMAWARVCNLRLDPHAQEHTRKFAEGIAAVVSPLFPVSFKALVPLVGSHE